MGADNIKLSRRLWLFGLAAALILWIAASPLRAYADDNPTGTSLEQHLAGELGSGQTSGGAVSGAGDLYGDYLADTPFEILNNRHDRSLGAQVGKNNFVGNLNQALGLTNLAFILDFVGVISAIIVIIISIIMLLLVNYPKTVAQTKQTIAHALITVMLIALLPLILDVVYNIVQMFMTAGWDLSNAATEIPEE